MLTYMRIICRADGNSEIGLGHLYRMVAIADFYIGQYDVVFVTSERSELSVIPSKFVVDVIPQDISLEHEAKWLSKNYSQATDIIVFDGYQFVSSYQKAIKSFSFKSIYIDDNATEYMYADIVVNPASISESIIYKGEPYTEHVFGSKYSMLRPRFYDLAGQARPLETLKSVFICFGGSDPLNLTILATKAVLMLENQFETIDVVLGSANISVELFALASENNKLTVHKSLNETELVDVMLSCDLAIVPASTISYELCCLNMVILAGYYVQNQKLIYDSLVATNTIFGCGDFTDYSIADFENKLIELLEVRDWETKLSNQSRLFDGKSKYRFLSLIDRLNMSFRKVNEDDLTLLYNWSNNKVVRENSYNKSEISFADHSQWFLRKLSDSNSLVLIAIINEKESGTIRYEFDTDSTTVGISISEEFRGRNLGSTMLRQSAIKYVETICFPVLAFIKVENDASVRAFKCAGYKFYRNEVVKGANSYVYKLEKENVCK